MMNTKTNPEDTALWQRRLAAQANNSAWRLSELKTRTEAQNQEMLHAAHAAMHLWSIVGNDNNRAHAIQLLAQVHALLGNASQAQTYLAESSAYFFAGDRDPWEVACAHAIAANVACCSGLPDAHQLHYQQAAELIAALPDPQDRDILKATLAIVPPPAARI